MYVYTLFSAGRPLAITRKKHRDEERLSEFSLFGRYGEILTMLTCMMISLCVSEVFQGQRHRLILIAVNADFGHRVSSILCNNFVEELFYGRRCRTGDEDKICAIKVGDAVSNLCYKIKCLERNQQCERVRDFVYVLAVIYSCREVRPSFDPTKVV